MKKIKYRKITLREAAGQGIAGHQDFNRCNSKTGVALKNLLAMQQKLCEV